MRSGTRSGAARRTGSRRERLTFNFGAGTAAGRGVVDAALARDQPTFATAEYAEPRDWGYFGLLLFTAVLLMRPQDLVPALEPLHLAEVCALVGLAPMMLHRLARRQPVFRVTPETTGLMVLGLVLVATIPFSFWPGGAFQEVMGSYLKVVLVFVLMMNTLTTPQRLERITWLILVCIGYIAAFSVFNYVRGVGLILGERLTGPVSGIFGNPNDLALNMVTFLPLATVTALGRRFSATRRVAALVIAALMLATIVFTKSRGGVVGLIAMLVALVLLGRRVRPGFGGAVVVTVLVAAPFMPSAFWERMVSIVDEKVDKEEFTGSRESRRIVMQEGIDTFVEHPLTGVGAGQFKNYNPPGRQERWRETHNALIQVAAETGVFGLIAFSFLIVRAWIATLTTRRMLRKPGRGRADPLASVLSERDRDSLYALTVAMTAGLVGWFTCAMFASVAYSWTFYYVLALIVAARELVKDRLAAVATGTTARAASRSARRTKAVRRMAPRLA
jgi:putative inorganic carbon (HCO3(-)) transporter